MKRTEIERLLPGVFQRTIHAGPPGEQPLLALLEVMESLHAPDEAILESLEQIVNPYQTPERFVPYLASWLDLERFLSDAPGKARTPPPWPAGTGQLRALVAVATELSHWRGTARGLLGFLETATGVPGFTIDEEVPGPDGQPRPFHFRVVAPAAAERFRTLIEAIIAQEKPAHVTYELSFG
jgi:phage tail-like protein